MGQVDDAAKDAGSGPQDRKPGCDAPMVPGSASPDQVGEPGVVANAPQVGEPGVVANAPQANGTVLWSIAKRGVPGGESTRGGTAVSGGTGSPEKANTF